MLFNILSILSAIILTIVIFIIFINDSVVENIYGFTTFATSAALFAISEVYSNWLFKELEIQKKDFRMNSSFIVYKKHRERCID